MFHYLPNRSVTVVIIPVIILTLVACSGSSVSEDESLLPTLAPTLDTSASVTDQPAEAFPVPSVEPPLDMLVPAGLSDAPGTLSDEPPPFLQETQPPPPTSSGPTSIATSIVRVEQYGVECPHPDDPLPDTVIWRDYELPFTEGDPLTITEYTWEDGEYRSTEIQCSADGDTITGDTQVITDVSRARLAQLVAELSAPGYTPSQEDLAQPEFSPVLSSDTETITVLGSAPKLEPIVEGQMVQFRVGQSDIEFPAGLEAAFAKYDVERTQAEQILAEQNVAPGSREEYESIQLCQGIFSDFSSNVQCSLVTSREISEFESKIDEDLPDPWVQIGSSFTIHELDRAAAGALVSALGSASISATLSEVVNFREDENRGLAIDAARTIAMEALQPQNQIPGEAVAIRLLHNPPNINSDDLAPPS